jgi:hypothetical protein
MDGSYGAKRVAPAVNTLSVQLELFDIADARSPTAATKFPLNGVCLLNIDDEPSGRRDA